MFVWCEIASDVMDCEQMQRHDRFVWVAIPDACAVPSDDAMACEQMQRHFDAFGAKPSVLWAGVDFGTYPYD